MKKSTPEFSETQKLFSNSDPDEVWAKAVNIVRRISPAHDFSHLRATFDDVVAMFRGEHPDYAAIATPYHDLSHTLSVFMCGVRLTHGMHVSGTRLTEQEVTTIMLATLFHDLGYAQPRGAASGTGAQYTRNHVARGIQLMQRYAAKQHYPPELADALALLMQGTDHMKSFASIAFPDERMRMLGQIAGTADLLGQMADRLYLEKLMFLYVEFREAGLDGYENIHDLLSKSFLFYRHTVQRLAVELGGVAAALPGHFREYLGDERNYYLESIEKNIAYLAKVLANEEMEFAVLLKRGDVVHRAHTQFQVQHA